MNARIDIGLTFDPTKTYKTRDGHRVINVQSINGARHWRGEIFGEGSYCWLSNGHVLELGEHGNDLMPGAIEDEVDKDAHETFEPFWQRMEGEVGALKQRLNQQTVIIADMAAKIEEHTKQLGELGQNVLRAVTSSDLAQKDGILSRLEDIEDRLDYHGIKLPAAQPTKVAAIDSSRWTGRAKPHGPGLSPPPKPTIKGGWVNVYRGKHKPHIGDLHFNRQEAEAAAKGDDHRIACIQIPDFVEGEGL